MNLVLVFIGGGLGSAARYGMSLAALRLGWIAFPYATLATNVIGCFVHTLRLQFLEFFGKWYRDGGRPFRPLTIKTKYVDIIEEE